MNDEVPLYLLLLWWGECVSLLSSLPPRKRAQALSRLAAEVRDLLAVLPDREVIPTWQINQAFGFEVFPLPPRSWRGLAVQQAGQPVASSEPHVVGAA